MVRLNFEHVYQPSATPNARTLLFLHGTGGDEHDLVPLAKNLDPTANILSPRGKVLERGMPRFFRRLAEGVFDTQDVIARTHELADFIIAAADTYAFDMKKVVAVGFSNGANIAGATLLLRPEVLHAAALWRPMIPLVPDVPPDLHGHKVLLTHGSFDTMISDRQRNQLEEMLRRYGANVYSKTIPTGHTLSQEDISITKRWLQEQTD